MTAFLTALIKPYFVFGCLLIAWPIKRWLQRNMKDGWLKELLLKRRGDSVEAAFVAADRAVWNGMKRLIGRHPRPEDRSR